MCTTPYNTLIVYPECFDEKINLNCEILEELRAGMSLWKEILFLFPVFAKDTIPFFPKNLLDYNNVYSENECERNHFLKCFLEDILQV